MLTTHPRHSRVLSNNGYCGAGCVPVILALEIETEGSLEQRCLRLVQTTQ